MFSSKSCVFLISVLSMWALAWMFLYCDASFDSERQNEEKRGEKKTEWRVSSSSSLSEVSMTPPAEHRENGVMKGWGKDESWGYSSEGTKPSLWKRHNGGQTAQKNKDSLKVAEQIVRNETQHPQDISTFSDKSLKMPTLCFLFLFLFCRIPGHEVQSGWNAVSQ